MLKAFLLGSVLALIAVAVARNEPATPSSDYLPDFPGPVQIAGPVGNESGKAPNNDLHRLITKP